MLSSTAKGLIPCVQDPFAERTSDERLLTDYVSVASPTSGGRAAAWFSKNWHLLNHIMEVRDSSRVPVRVVWLDLLDELPSQLREARLGMELARSTGQITQSHYRALCSLVNDTTFLQMAASATKALYHGSDSELVQTLSAIRERNSNQAEELIVVVDGWDGLSQTVPSRLEGRLRTLEQTILDALPRERTSIIWVSDGVQHTANSILYQRTCLRPLQHDSPRRNELDEVIWNLPVRPRVLGWQTPWSSEHRMIVQDTPTTVSPWRCMINVPHIADWAARFRGASSRRRNVLRSEVMAIATGPMHGRLVTLSSVQSQPVYLNGDDAEQLMNDAFDLAPSLLRTRGTDAEPEESPAPSKAVFVTQTVASGRPPTLVDRIHLTLGRPPPEPGRAKARYVPARMITRGWIHKSTHEDEADERKRRVSRCPPQYGRTELIDVDTTDHRRRELRRVLRAARYLRLLIEPYDEMCDPCGEVIRVCHDALHETGDHSARSTEPESRERYRRALTSVRDLILTGPRYRRTWAKLRPEREGIRNVLTSDNRLVLAMALKKEPELLTLYGHNLFLALLVAMTKAGDDPTHAAAVSLWRTVAQWQLYQVGFRPADLPEHMARPVYDIRSIYSGLLSRAKRLHRTQQPARVQGRTIVPETQVSHRLGLAFSAGADEPLWVLLPTGEGGYAIGLTGSIMLGTWWTKCVTDPEELRAAAEEMLDKFDSETAIRLMVTYSEDTRLLSLWDEESEMWNPLGGFSLRLIRGCEHLLDWLRIDELSPGIQPPDLLEIPSPGSRDLGIVVRRFLKRLAEPIEDTVQVECSVSVEPDAELYKIVFSSDGAEVQAFTTDSTAILTRTLREPQHARLRDGRGRTMNWDPRTDIRYHSTGLLMPQVEGSRTFSGRIPCPKSAVELLNAEVGENVTLVVRGERSGGKKTFSVRLDGVPQESGLRGLDRASLTATEICMLCACGELFDSMTQSRHRVVLDASGVTDERLLKYLRSDDLGCEVVGVEREDGVDEGEAEEHGWTDVSYEENGEPEDGKLVGPGSDDRQMRLVSAEVHRSRTDHEKRVVVYMTPVDSSGDLIERTVIQRVGHEATMSRGQIEEAVRRGLRGLRLEEKELKRAYRAAVRVLRADGVRVLREADDRNALGSCELS